MNTWKGLLAGMSVLCCTFSGHAAGIFRVDAASTATTPDGQSWANAYKTLQAGTDAAYAAAGGEIWAKAGVYTALTDPVLTMKSGVSLYGGFAGTESSRTQRNLSVNASTIDGQNARRCVLGSSNAVLDGFTVTHGYNSDGGAGMYNDSASPMVANCAFTANSAPGDVSPSIGLGGAMANGGSYAVLTNCTFTGNSAKQGGGAMANISSYPVLTNCTFTGNSAAMPYGIGGGAILNSSSSPTLKNCILWGDAAGAWPEIYDTDPPASKTTATYSCIQGGYTGTGNINADPLFASATAGNLRIQAGSSCIDKGTAAGAPTQDILGTTRPQGAGIDIGAHEAVLTGTDTTPPVIGACAADQTVSADTNCMAPVPDFRGHLSATDNMTLPQNLTITQVPAPGLAMAPGDTSVTLTVTDGAGNAANCAAKLTVADRTAPVIALAGSASVTVDCGGAYTDAGATAEDFCSGNLTGSIVTAGLPPSVPLGPGAWTITYDVRDSAGNAATTVSRRVTVRDNCTLAVNAVGETLIQSTIGGRVELTVAVTGAVGSVRYQWSKEGAAKDGKAFAVLPGATGPTLVINPVRADSAGFYICAVSDAVTTVNGPVFTLTPPAPEPVPAVGVFGLALVAGLLSLGGVSALQRRKQ